MPAPAGGMAASGGVVAAPSSGGTMAADDQPGNEPAPAGDTETIDMMTDDPSLHERIIGSYAVRLTQRDTITVGLVGSASMRTIVLATGDIAEDPESAELRLTVNLCDYKLAPDMMEKHLTDLTLSIPSTTLSNTSLDPAAVSLGQTSGEALAWETRELHGVAGWMWESPSDELPSSTEDPRVFDQDEDGYPGITTVFDGHESGALYLAMVYRWTFSGTVTDNGDLIGSTQSRSKETLLGSDQSAALVTSFEREPDPDTTDNTVRFVRRPAPLTCAELLAEADTLFL